MPLRKRFRFLKIDLVPKFVAVCSQRILKILLLIFSVLVFSSIFNAALAGVGNTGPWGDQGNGTFANPILPADYSDPDAILVGGD